MHLIRCIVSKVYFISGLGADKRAFSFLDLSFCDPVFIQWIKPHPNESLQSYALRLKDQIQDPQPVIVGISLGGMLVTEMAKADNNVNAIILSSNKTAEEFPKILRVGKYFPIYKWLPATLLKRITAAGRWFMGVDGANQRQLIRQIIRDTNMDFAKWAIEAILRWENRVIPSNLIHVHGSADRLLPCKLVKADHIIPGGTHIMIMNKHAEISALLKKLILNRT